MKRLFCGILAGLLLCLTGCGAQPEPEQLSLFAMDTYMSLAAYALKCFTPFANAA